MDVHDVQKITYSCKPWQNLGKNMCVKGILDISFLVTPKAFQLKYFGNAAAPGVITLLMNLSAL